jgi:hypothetical protein
MLLIHALCSRPLVKSWDWLLDGRHGEGGAGRLRVSPGRFGVSPGRFGVSPGWFRVSQVGLVSPQADRVCLGLILQWHIYSRGVSTPVCMLLSPVRHLVHFPTLTPQVGLVCPQVG